MINDRKRKRESTRARGGNPNRMQTLTQLQIMICLNKGGKWISRREAVKRLGWYPSTFDHCVSRLIHIGMVERDRQADDFSTSSHYRLTKKGEEWCEEFMDKLMGL